MQVWSILLQVWEGLNVVQTGRNMLGATNPFDSSAGTIRGDYCIQVGRWVDRQLFFYTIFFQYLFRVLKDSILKYCTFTTSVQHVMQVYLFCALCFICGTKFSPKVLSKIFVRYMLIFCCRNICHGSDSVEGAKHEIALWFKPAELIQWKSSQQDWIYEDSF